MKGRDKLLCLILFISFFILTACKIENPPDMIIINGKILTVDLMDCPVNQIMDIQSELTIVGGKIVYSSEGE